jgi:hypothetical protein
MDEDKFIAALKRKFKAVEAEPREPEPDDPPPPPATSSTPERKCALCRRSLTSLVWGEQDGRWWCPKSEAEKCTRIAAGRLGASASGAGNSSLKGALDPDGKCRDCGAEVRWVKTQRGKKMPVDVLPAPAGVDGFELVGETDTLAFYVSEKRRARYFGDCYEFHGKTCEGSRRRRR